MALVWLGLDKLAVALKELIKNVEFGPDPTPGTKVEGLNVLDDAINVPQAWNTERTETDLLILLAIKMQVVAELRAGPDNHGEDLQAAMTQDQANNAKAVLKEQERQVVRIVYDLSQWWDGAMAYALRDKRPLTKQDCPFVIFTEQEHFLLLQDIFFKTPDVK